jgi:hypothetical protein
MIKIVNNKTGAVMGTALTFPDKLGDRVFIDGTLFQVIACIPCYKTDGDKLETPGSFAYVDEISDAVDLSGGIPAVAVSTETYIITHPDGRKMNNADLVVLDMQNDRYAQRAMKVYCDAAEKDPDKCVFAAEILNRLKKIRKGD